MITPFFNRKSSFDRLHVNVTLEHKVITGDFVRQLGESRGVAPGSCLRLEHCTLTEGGITALAELLRHRPAVTHLDISRCNVSDDRMILLLTQLGTRRFDRLNLSGNHLGTQAASSALGDYLAHAGAPHVLTLRDTRLNDAGLKRVALGLSGQSAPVVFDLSDNRLGNAAVDTLAMLQSTGAAFETLDLSRNKIENAGAATAAKLIGPGSLLLRLNLAENKIGNSGTSGLLNAIGPDTPLQSLDMRRNKIGRAAVPALIALFGGNSTLAYANFQDNPLLWGNTEEIYAAACRRKSPNLLYLHMGVEETENFKILRAHNYRAARVWLERLQAGAGGLSHAETVSVNERMPAMLTLAMQEQHVPRPLVDRMLADLGEHARNEGFALSCHLPVPFPAAAAAMPLLRIDRTLTADALKRVTANGQSELEYLADQGLLPSLLRPDIWEGRANELKQVIHQLPRKYREGIDVGELLQRTEWSSRGLYVDASDMQGRGF